MHKALRLKVRKAKAIERKIQELAFNGKSEARRERAKMIENRHWYDRDLNGELRTGNDREVKGQTLVVGRNVVGGVRSI